MCFSATASFTASALLVSTGIFSTITAYRHNKPYLFLALIPIIFGIQQSIEGLIWLKLNAEQLSCLSLYPYAYLFFAYYFWPFYFPSCVYMIEENALRKKILRRLIVAGALLGTVIYLPILLEIIPIKTQVVEHSIHYETYQSATLIWLYSIGYVSILVLSLLCASSRKINLLGFITLFSAIASYCWYIYAFTSVWCFFSAVLSIYIAYLIYTQSPPQKTSKRKLSR